MASALKRERAVARISSLAREGLDVATFWQAAGEEVGSVVPVDGGICWYTMDPASLLVTSHYNVEMPVLPHDFLATQYLEDDFLQFGNIARHPDGVTTLHGETGGDPSRSKQYREYVQPYGAEQVLAACLRTADKQPWGIATLYRDTGRTMFDEDDLAFMREVSGPLADGARRGLLIGEATDPEGPEAPGLIVLGEDWAVESMTPEAERWLREFPDGATDTRQLPSAVYSVAGQAARTARGFDAPGEVASARVLSRSGRWISLHGAALMTDGKSRAAVIIEPAQAARIFPLLMDAFQLTEREREVTRHVLQGASTNEIAGTLFISTHTVQQHLKSIFDKSGVRSRRELVGKVFFSHYEPRVRDNEQRAEISRPLRGGPLSRS